MRKILGLGLAVFIAFGTGMGMGMVACSSPLPPVTLCKTDDDCHQASQAVSLASCDVTSGLCRVARETGPSERPADVPFESTPEEDRPPPEEMQPLPDEARPSDEKASPDPLPESLEGRREPATEALAERPEDAASSEPSRPEARLEASAERRPEREETPPEPRPEKKPEATPEQRPEATDDSGCLGQTESCNGKDDDCDGKIDEILKNPCYTGPIGTQGIGLCKAGEQTCVGGFWGACTKEVTPKAEICDGKDNNCDGKTDENCLLIKAGTFTQGSPTSEAARESDERPHPVTLTRDFFIQATEVTQGDFQALMGYNPSAFPACGPTCPVEDLYWAEALAYANALSRKEGFPECFACTGSKDQVSCSLRAVYPTPYACPGWRLPTEAEWEYAARAGTTTATYKGDAKDFACTTDAMLTTIAWYCANSNSRTQPVRQKLPNAWGLYDMLGNVWEWVWDRYDPYPTSAVIDPVGATSGSRILRGGSYTNVAGESRCANRSFSGTRSRTQGFRLVRTNLPIP